MSLKAHVYSYGVIAFVIFIFVIVAYTTETNWSYAEINKYLFPNIPNGGCYLSLEINTGIFKKKIVGSLTTCNKIEVNSTLTYNEQVSDIGCFSYSEDTYECGYLRSAQNASTVSLLVAIILLVSTTLASRIVSKEGPIDLNKLRTYSYLILVNAFVLMLCCFISIGDYRSFLISISTIEWYGVTYSVEWSMQFSWFLMLLAGMFSLTIIFRVTALLYAISRANESNNEVYATAVIISGPVNAQATVVQHTSSQNPIVRGVVVSDANSSLNAPLI